METTTITTTTYKVLVTTDPSETLFVHNIIVWGEFVGYECSAAGQVNEVWEYVTRMPQAFETMLDQSDVVFRYEEVLKDNYCV